MALDQALSTPLAIVLRCPQRHLTLSLARPRNECEAILKNYELFIYGEIHYCTN